MKSTQNIKVKRVEFNKENASTPFQPDINTEAGGYDSLAKTHRRGTTPVLTQIPDATAKAGTKVPAVRAGEETNELTIPARLTTGLGMAAIIAAGISGGAGVDSGQINKFAHEKAVLENVSILEDGDN